MHQFCNKIWETLYLIECAKTSSMKIIVYCVWGCNVVDAVRKNAVSYLSECKFVGKGYSWISRKTEPPWTLMIP